MDFILDNALIIADGILKEHADDIPRIEKIHCFPTDKEYLFTIPPRVKMKMKIEEENGNSQ